MNDPMSGCMGKVAMRADAAKRMSKRRGMHVYRCDYCRLWHLASPDRRRAGRR